MPAGPHACSSREDILKEIDILARCDHPNVMFLKEYFEENNKVLPRSLQAADCPVQPCMSNSWSLTPPPLWRPRRCT